MVVINMDKPKVFFLQMQKIAWAFVFLGCNPDAKN